MLDFLIRAAHAQAKTTPAAAAQQDPYLSILIWIVPIAILYFLILRPQMKRNKEQKNLWEKLSKGDEVVTSGGLTGRVVEVGESYMSLELTEGVVIKIQKQAVVGLLPKGSLKSL